MKHLLAILLMFSLALPWPGWSRALDHLPCAEAADKACFSPGQPDQCACCQKGQCACLYSADKTPAKPVPSVPPRPVLAGDPIFHEAPQPFVLPATAPVQSVQCVPSLAVSAALYDQAVPFYIRHCSLLW